MRFRYHVHPLKLETGHRNLTGSYVCASCRCAIIGSRFKEMNSHFGLCSQCYIEVKVPSTCNQEEYIFKEYDTDTEYKRLVLPH